MKEYTANDGCRAHRQHTESGINCIVCKVFFIPRHTHQM